MLYNVTMRFILTTDWEDGLADLSQRLIEELAAGKRVLWLLSGGSNIPASVTVMDNISRKLRQNLTVMLGDERYGPVGHPDSNATQLTKAGFKPAPAVMLAVLQPEFTLAETTTHYRELASQAFGTADVIISQLGMGEDGHVAGILPNSAASHETIELVTGYSGKPFDRLSLTFPAFRQVTAAYVFAFGATKRLPLSTLRTKRLDPNIQPAQILKQLGEVYIYNDQVGG